MDGVMAFLGIVLLIVALVFGAAMAAPFVAQAFGEAAAQVEAEAMVNAPPEDLTPPAWMAEGYLEITSKTGVELPNVEVDASYHWEHPEAVLIRECYDRGDVFQILMEPDKQTFHCLVQIPDGRTGDRVITPNGVRWFEKTSFCPKGGFCLKDVMDWLTRKGATRYTRPLVK